MRREGKDFSSDMYEELKKKMNSEKTAETKLIPISRQPSKSLNTTASMRNS